jgi:hypothetical protein
MRHHPEAKTRGWQVCIQRHVEAEMLVDRHVARGEGEQPASHPLGAVAVGHLAHEGAADTLPLVPRLDAEPGEMPMRLWSKRAHGAIPVGDECLEAGDRLAAPRGADLPPPRRVAILLRNGGMRWREPAGDPRERGGVTQTSPCASPKRRNISIIGKTPETRSSASGRR